MKAHSEEIYGKWTQGTQCWKTRSVAYNVVADNTGLSKFVQLFLRAKSAKFSENLNLYSSSFNSTFKDHVTSNILDSQVTNNSRCFRVPSSKSEPYRHSFFVRTIIDWNHLVDDIVDAPSTEVFPERLANIQPDCLHNLISVQEFAPHLLSP